MFSTRIYLLIALTFNLIIESNAQTTKKMETNFNQQQQEVYSTIEKMVTAFESKNIDGVLATYEKGAIVMFEPGKPVTGHNALRQAFTQFVNLNPNYTFFSHEVYI